MRTTLRERPARAVADAVRRAGGGPARSPAAAGELAAAARRANAGPHAAQLAALAPRVGARPCPGCQAARAGMHAAARPPVQRVLLGTQQQFDTLNPAHFAGVLGHLLSLSYDALVHIRGLLDPANAQERIYIEVIDYELEKADALADIDQLGRDEGGLHTTASVFVDGQLITRTDAQQHPTDGQEYYARMLRGKPQSPAEKAAMDEDRISRNDSEVGTLEDAWEALDAYLPPADVCPPVKVRILLSGTAGPCNGCKRRLLAFRDDVRARLPQGSMLWIESAYLNATSMVNRSGRYTRYGFADERTDYTPGGLRYWRRYLPVEHT